MNATEVATRIAVAKAAVAKTKTRHTTDSATGEIVIDPEMLVGIREMAERLIALGLSGYGESDEEVDRARSAITTLISRREETISEKGVKRSANGFPLPLTQLKATGLYDWAEVEEWLRNFYSVRVAA